MQGAVNLLDTPGIAAYTAAGRIEGFANSFGISLGSAISVFIAQNYGAKKSERVREGLKQGMLICLVSGIAMSILLYLFSRPGILIFLDSGEEQAVAFGVTYLQQMVLFYIMCFTGNGFVGYFKGTGHVYVPLIATTLHISVRAGLSYLLVGIFGLRAVALATGAGWSVMTVLQIAATLYFMRKENTKKAIGA